MTQTPVSAFVFPVKALSHLYCLARKEALPHWTVCLGRLPARNFLVANMKTIILSMVLVIGFCGLAGAQSAQDSIGTWKCEYKIGDQNRTSTLTITKDGDKLAGTMDWPDQKDAKLKDVKMKDGELTFSAERVVGGNTFNVEYKLKVDGDKLKGKGAVVTGDEKREFDFEGKREKKDK
jgi:hypothetical protein